MVQRSILVVDDEPNLRHTLSLILKQAGYLVTTASNAKETMHSLEAGPFDLVCLDIKLPDINGLSLLPEIRKLYAEMPVLILTGHATVDTAMESVRHGARDYIIKPVDPGYLLGRVKEILSEKTQSQKRRELIEQIQNLLLELNEIDGTLIPPASLLTSVSPVDPTRLLRKGSLTLDLHTRTVVCGDEVITLPPSRFDYLVTLVRHSPDPVTYETLVMESQGYQVTRSEAREIARWQVHELRKAIELEPDNPKLIITIRNVGYRLVV
jgi:DNA-binding response OmpR family regulator